MVTSGDRSNVQHMESLLLVGTPPNGESDDEASHRYQLLGAARHLIAEVGTGKVSMDGLAARAGVGKETVLCRFGSRAGIFRALLSDAERDLRLAVLSSDPPLGPGAPPLDRLIAYGQARVHFLLDNYEIARAALDGSQPIFIGRETTPFSRVHIGTMLAQIRPEVTSLDVLAMQLTAALDGPLLLKISSDDVSETEIEGTRQRLTQGWTDLVALICGT